MPGFGRKNGIPAKAETETAAGQADDARQRQETRQKRKPSQGRTKPVAYGSKRRTHCATGGKRPAGRQRATGKTTVACRRARQIEERSAADRWPITWQTDSKPEADRRQIGGQSLANRQQIGGRSAANHWQTGNRSVADRQQTGGRSAVISGKPVTDRRQTDSKPATVRRQIGSRSAANQQQINGRSVADRQQTGNRSEADRRQISGRSEADWRSITGNRQQTGSRSAADRQQIGGKREYRADAMRRKTNTNEKTSIMEEKYAFLWDLVRQTQMSPLFIQSLRIAGVVRSKIVCDLQGNPYVKYSVDDLKRWMSANWEEYRIRRGPRPAKYNILSA